MPQANESLDDIGEDLFDSASEEAEPTEEAELPSESGEEPEPQEESSEGEEAEEEGEESEEQDPGSVTRQTKNSRQGGSRDDTLQVLAGQIQQQQKQIETLLKQIETQNAPKAGPTLDPFSDPQGYMRALRAQYEAQGREITETDLSMDLLYGQQQFMHKSIKKLHESINQIQGQTAQQAKVQEASKKVDRLFQQYPHLDTDEGHDIVDAFLAKGAREGKEDLELAFRLADKALSGVSTEYAKRKLQSVKTLKGQKPRGGSPAGPTRKQYGSTLGALEDIAEDLVKEGY